MEAGDHDGTSEAALLRGRDAFGRSAWSEAYDAFAAAQTESDLDPDDLSALAEAAFCTGHLDEAIRAYEAAFGGYLDARNVRRAALVAMWGLAVAYQFKGVQSVADGWNRRAERLLSDEPECVEQGWVALGLGDTGRSLALARQFGDRNLEARSLHRRGRELVEEGRVAEGMALIDDVCTSIAAGEIRPYEASFMYCMTTGLCVEVADYRRAREWWEVSHPYYLGFGPNVFPSFCRVSRAAMMQVEGSWDDAEREGHAALEELRAIGKKDYGVAARGLGDVRLKRGDLPGAEEAYREAHEAGVDPQPGLALVRLAQGRSDGALALIRRSLEEVEDGDRVQRTRLLPALVTIALEAGVRDIAGPAADELWSAAEDIGTPAFRAAAADARGAMQRADGDAGEAAKTLRRALALWRDADAPYEAARTRLLLGDAYLSTGDGESAAVEFEAARTSFERLGAGPDAQRAAESLRRAAAGGNAVTARKTFMFTDIVGSTALIEAVGDDAWRDLLLWHDGSLRMCFGEHGGEEVDHAGDGFFVAFPKARAAIDCAIGIQRKLVEHRRAQGFAPQVRIGLHATEAMIANGRYTGGGVHTAARIGALAEGGDVLVSLDTLAGLDDYARSEPRFVTLRGIKEPVEIVSLAWR